MVSESFLPDLNGVANSAARTAECLVRRGHEVLLIAPAPADERDRARRALPYRVEWIASKAWPRNKLRLGLPTPAVGQALREQRPDVVFLLNPYLMGGRALKEAGALDVPSVALYFTDVEMIAGSGASNQAVRQAGDFLASVHGMAGVNLAPTRAAAIALAGHGVEQVEVWEPGVDATAFSPARRSDRLRVTLAPDGELIVGYVGRLATEKQVDLLAGVAALPGVRLVIVGQGPDAPRLRTLLGGARFAGARRGSALARWYASLDVFAHPGAYDTFGLTVREAQASGCAVVVPDAGGVACLVEDGVTGRLLPPHDTQAFTRVIAGLADDRDAVRRLGASARAMAEGRSWETATTELLGHFQVAMDGRRLSHHGGS